jgi:multidrug efflux pump subunit AcrB
VIAVEAVGEVGNPTILATFAVIAAILPMAFVGGLMGPYMRPIPIGASAAMFFSLLIAFIVTPWAAVRILRGGGQAHRRHAAKDREPRPRTPRGFLHPALPRMMGPLIHTAWRWAFLGITLLLLGAMATGRHRLGEGEDAALRQQERVPGHPQHARGQRAGADRPRRPRDGRRHRTNPR